MNLFFGRLKKLSNLGWEEINKSSRHSYGWEKIPIDILHCKENIKQLNIVARDTKSLMAFRYTGNNLPFLGIHRCRKEKNATRKRWKE